ncbi:hypothetical protein [Cyanobium gracile]|uniref:Uncharacterized protein n=1 Tax=Cyanobium gracile UHCC 0281 TaxID=3110309 RepID=A0ABU5SRI1_9CYAN|nr:hypothetical protein [Cyanobium gracile]MEA5441109.1 hypothetical protein [Cyanobium gracile UHCC 0281]
MGYAMDTKSRRFIALAELLLVEINAANELPATVENVAELLERMIRTIDAYRATGGDVADLLRKTVQVMDAYRATGGDVAALLAASNAGTKLSDLGQFLSPTNIWTTTLDAG